MVQISCFHRNLSSRLVLAHICGLRLEILLPQPKLPNKERKFAVELMQLEMFVAVAEGGSILKASERVLRTQPAVSIAIRKLENEIGAPLFDRSHRYQFRLTEVGEVLYGYATRLLSFRAEAASAVAKLVHVRSGRLRVGANESISINLLPKLTHAFLTRYPNVQIELQCDRSQRILSELTDHQIDVALVSFMPDNSELESQFMMRDNLALITSPQHPFVERQLIAIEDLAEQPVIVMDAACIWHKNLVDAFIRSKAPLNLSVDNAPIETVKRMVALGLGVGFVPRMCVQDEVANGELAIVEVEGLHEERSLYLVRRRATHSHAAQAFVKVALSFGKSPSSMIPSTPAQRISDLVPQILRRSKLLTSRHQC